MSNPFPHKLTDQIMALPFQIYMMATEMPNVPAAQKWGAALVLLIVTLGLNAGGGNLGYGPACGGTAGRVEARSAGCAPGLMAVRRPRCPSPREC